ncbi:hypothetical protein PMAYCL1PPCAC_10752 [Pristionchus mayeri]|uniref:Glucosylceramidase n=1 Tax=Pristionchus mayeri TaxID=1317129 RepID=A0AAN4ZLQ2_9BILA|nr:hypothetical protein PMAYCL1PPCAC_10752 [Pristionchus mayeri]
MDRMIVKQKPQPEGIVVEIDPSTLYQEIIGFGAAFTDSSGFNIRSLPKDAQDLLMKQYFGPTGTEYNLGRVPIASTDFSFSQYSYDDVEGDLELVHWALREEDYEYKIPFIKQAMELTKSTGAIKFFAAPWAPPGWMKTNGEMKGGGTLLGDPSGPYHVTWANYFVKFFEAYLSQGISFWAVSPQNEPNTGLYANYSWQTLGFTAQTESDFVRDHLGPALKASNASKDIVIFGMDDNRHLLPDWADVMFADPIASSYVAGIGVHWYEDELVNPSILSTTHDRHPEKFILATEACNGWLKVQGKGVRLGFFFRAERYAHSIIEDLNNWVAGWTDWNMALDMQGGYTWAGNAVDAPIVVDGQEFYKQPMYYSMAHFSKFLKPGARRAKVGHPKLPQGVFVLGAVMVDGKRYVTIVNKNNTEDITISILETGIDGVCTTVFLPAHSLVTVVWNKY